MWVATPKGRLVNLANMSVVTTDISEVTGESVVIAWETGGGVERDAMIEIGSFPPEIAAAVLEKLADMLGAVSVTAIAYVAGPAASVRNG